VRISAPPRAPSVGCPAGSSFLTEDFAWHFLPRSGLAGGSALANEIPLKNSARFVWSLHSSLEYPRSSREALPGSDCRPPRWRFSVSHSLIRAMAAVEFPVEAFDSRIGDGAWFWGFGRSRFLRGLPPASGLESACLRTAPWHRCPKIGGARSAVSHGP
jgi:hypothetical protein